MVWICAVFLNAVFWTTSLICVEHLKAVQFGLDTLWKAAPQAIPQSQQDSQKSLCVLNPQKDFSGVYAPFAKLYDTGVLPITEFLQALKVDLGDGSDLLESEKYDECFCISCGKGVEKCLIQHFFLLRFSLADLHNALNAVPEEKIEIPEMLQWKNIRPELRNILFRDPDSRSLLGSEAMHQEWLKTQKYPRVARGRYGQAREIQRLLAGIAELQAPFDDNQEQLKKAQDDLSNHYARLNASYNELIRQRDALVNVATERRKQGLKEDNKLSEQIQDIANQINAITEGHADDLLVKYYIEHIQALKKAKEALVNYDEIFGQLSEALEKFHKESYAAYLKRQEKFQDKWDGNWNTLQAFVCDTRQRHEWWELLLKYMQPWEQFEKQHDQCARLIRAQTKVHSWPDDELFVCVFPGKLRSLRENAVSSEEIKKGFLYAKTHYVYLMDPWYEKFMRSSLHADCMKRCTQVMECRQSNIFLAPDVDLAMLQRDRDEYFKSHSSSDKSLSAVMPQCASGWFLCEHFEEPEVA